MPSNSYACPSETHPFPLRAAVSNLMKKWLLMICVASTFVDVSAQTGGIKVFVNQKPVTFSDQQPIEKAGKVYVPMRGVFQHLGAAIWYDEAAKVVHAKRGDKHIEVPIGKDWALKDDVTTVSGARAIIVNGRAMVPLRFLAENLDADVDWIGAERAVHINTMATVSSTGGAGGTVRNP